MISNTTYHLVAKIKLHIEKTYVDCYLKSQPPLSIEHKIHLHMRTVQDLGHSTTINFLL